MKKESYEQKLMDVLNGQEIKDLKSENDNIIVKIEEINSTLLEMRKQELKSE